MDPVLSSLFPTYKIGNDGFSWWIGQVENNKDPKNSGRIQVRIVGQHNREGDITPTADLPWANVTMPLNVPFTTGGTTGATNNIQIGGWVIGFFMDNECQRPLVIGSIAHTKASTYKDLQEYTPDLKSLGFKPTKAVDLKSEKHRSADEQSGKDKKGAITDGGIPAVGTSNLNKKVPPAVGALKGKESDLNPTGGQMCVAIADPNCDAKDLGDDIKKIVGELLANTQASGGNIGSYYVSKINGELYSAVDIPRSYVTKINRVVSSFGSRVKKEIIYGIREAIDELIQLIMGVQSAKDLADQGADKTKNPKESYIPVTERGNFLKDVINTINTVLNEVGCSFKKTLDDLINFIIDLLMEYLIDAISAAFCLIDNIVDSIVSYIDSAFSTLVETVLGPLQDLLGTAGSYLDIIGGVVSRVLNILGISCTGVEDKCNKDKTRCTDGGSDDKKEDEKDFLDKLIDEIEKGSLTGGDLSVGDKYSRGVCEDAKANAPEEETEVFFVGGVETTPANSSYVAETTTIPDIPIETIDFPTDLPNPLTDYRKDTDPFIEYKIVAREDVIESGGIVTFDITGPERNGVLEVEVISATTGIAQEEPYEECVVNTDDGLGVGFTVLPARGVIDGEEVVVIEILAPGKGYLVGMVFTISGSKVGGQDGVDDVTFVITKVGELINYKIFGDVYEKGLVNPSTYPEYGELLYSEPTTFPIATNKLTDWDVPGYVGLEFTSKRAADSATIWDEDPKTTFPEEIPDVKFVSLTTDKESYIEGETINYAVNTIGYNNGTIFNYKIFGGVSESDYKLSDEDKKVLINDSLGEFYIYVIEDDDDTELTETLTVLLFEDGTDKPVASKTIFIVAEEKDEEETPFTLSPDTTQEQLEEYLNNIVITKEKDFADQKTKTPPELGVKNPLTPNVPSNIPKDPPTAGTPVTDDVGSIISISIDNPGGKTYQIPPKVIIRGKGSGAAGIALLDRNGFVSEIRVTRIGSGYKRNVSGQNTDSICVIDSFTLIRPGFGYTEQPTLYIDGDPNIGEIIIDDNGFITGARVLNRSKSFTTIPDILIAGGGGVGGFVLPSLVCLPQEELERKGYVKIGTGSYIDCP
jgi:hypothetical protein